MNRSTRGSRRSPLWKDIFKTGRARNKPNENQSSNKLALPQELEDIMKNKKVRLKHFFVAGTGTVQYQRNPIMKESSNENYLEKL